MDFVPKSFVVTHGYHFMVGLLCTSVQSLLAPTPLHPAHQQPFSKLIKFYVRTTIIIPKGTRNRSGHLIGPTLNTPTHNYSPFCYTFTFTSLPHFTSRAACFLTFSLITVHVQPRPVSPGYITIWLLCLVKSLLLRLHRC